MHYQVDAGGDRRYDKGRSKVCKLSTVDRTHATDETEMYAKEDRQEPRHADEGECRKSFYLCLTSPQGVDRLVLKPEITGMQHGLPCGLGTGK